MSNMTRALLLACAFVASSAASSVAEIACKPLLSIKAIREIRVAPVQPWTWQATIVADTSYCATRDGRFEIDFMRIKEYSPDMQFTEKYRWKRGEFEVSMELAGDEAIQDHRIGFIASCVCRDIPYDD